MLWMQKLKAVSIDILQGLQVPEKSGKFNVFSLRLEMSGIFWWFNILLSGKLTFTSPSVWINIRNARPTHFPMQKIPLQCLFSFATCKLSKTPAPKIASSMSLWHIIATHIVILEQQVLETLWRVIFVYVL